MKNRAAGKKANLQIERVVRQHAIAGGNAVALDPPDYGIDFVDRGLATRSVSQAAVDPAQRKPRQEDPWRGTFGAERLKQGPAPQSGHTGLPDRLKTGIESLSGMSLDDVSVHYNSSRPAQLDASAYARGSDIYIAPGGERHLPHEAWHVVQQAQGRVKQTMQMKDGVPVNDDQGLEKEADVMGNKALQSSAGASHAGRDFMADASGAAQTRRKQASAQLQSVLQMNGLANFITMNHYQAGNLTVTMDYATMGADRQQQLHAYLIGAQLQSTNTMFHGNEAGNLPAHGWESRECSRYIEFNLGFPAYNRVMYDAETGALYLTPHYDGYVRINNPPADAVARMEEIASETAGFILRDFNVEMARDLPNAWQKITALRSYQLDQEALGM